MAYGIDTLYDSQTGDKIIMSASKPAVPDGQTVVLKDGEFRVGGGVKGYNIPLVEPDGEIIKGLTQSASNIRLYKSGKIAMLCIDLNGSIAAATGEIKIAEPQDIFLPVEWIVKTCASPVGIPIVVRINYQNGITLENFNREASGWIIRETITYITAL